MEFHVGDYVENAEDCAYWSDEEVNLEWIRKNCPRLENTWSHSYPPIGTRGTIMCIAPYINPWGKKIEGVMYFLSDDRKGYLVDEDNFPKGIIEITEIEEDD